MIEQKQLFRCRSYNPAEETAVKAADANCYPDHALQGLRC
jgi:hypothetical protein